MFCESFVIVNEYTYKRSMDEVWVGMKDMKDRFFEKLNANYGFTFNVDEQIRKTTFQKPTLFLCVRQDVTVDYREQLELYQLFEKILKNLKKVLTLWKTRVNITFVVNDIKT